MPSYLDDVTIAGAPRPGDQRLAEMRSVLQGLSGDGHIAVHAPAAHAGYAGKPWIVVGIVCAAAIGGTALYRLREIPAAIPASTLQTATIVSDNAKVLPPAVILQAKGFIEAARQATVSAETTGRIVSLLVTEGQSVRSGQAIAHLNTRIPEAQVNYAQAQLEVASRNVSISRARLAASRTVLGRRAALAPEGWVSQASLDEAADNTRELQAQLRSDLGQVDVQRRQLDLDRQSLVNADIVAPFDGKVVAVSANVGEIVSPISAGGGFTRTGICTIADFSSLQGKVQLNEQHLDKIAEGTKVLIHFVAYPTLTAHGHVATITPAVDRATAAVDIKIAFETTPREAMPGMQIDIDFLSK